MNMGITGNFRMKFIGRPGGVPMKGAPGNFIHGKEYIVPYGHSKFKFWELLEEEPVLKVPDDDTPFEEAYYVPEEDEEEITMSDSAAVVGMTSSNPIDSEYNIDPNAPALIDPYMTFSQSTGKLREYVAPEPKPEPTPDPEPEPEQELDEAHYLKLEIARLQQQLEDAKTPEPVKTLSRDELKDVLDKAGVEYKKQARNNTLQKLVDALNV